MDSAINKSKQHLKRTVRGLFLTVILTGCLAPENKGSEETVGAPVSGEADFVVNPPPNPGTGGTGNAGPETTPPPAPSPMPTSPSVEFDFKLNNGAAYFHSAELQMQFSYLPWFVQMKVSANGNCEGGTWEPVVESRSVTSGFPRNSVVTYSVQYQDVDRVRSNCLSASILHDDKGPDILFSKYPSASLEEGSTSEILFEVRDLSPIREVTCTLNQVTKPCLAGLNSIRLTPLPVGTYTFSVSAEDQHGYRSSQEVRWTVVNSIRSLRHTVLVRDDRKVDILFVIDNSGSMHYEQRSMASRVRNFLSILSGLDYQIAVTTTDPRTTRTSGGITYYGDGDLIPLHGMQGALWLHSTLNAETAQLNLGRTLQRSETGSGSEQGIFATYRFIEKATTAGHRYQPFFRSGANFATIVISDEDESANTTKNDPEQLLQLVQSRFGGQKAFSFHSIVTRPGDVACRNTHGAAYGERYKRMTELTGGVLGSVCESDYAQQVAGIAEQIRDLVKSITLSCEPLTQFPIEVRRNGAPYSGSFVVEGVNLKFASILEPGEYHVDYKCLK